MARVVRPFGRALLIAFACVALRAALIAGQTTSEYRSLVDQYATRDGPSAMAAMARWSRPVVAELKVKLKTGGADVTARPGYFVGIDNDRRRNR
jgi:hypothetical protein